MLGVVLRPKNEKPQTGDTRHRYYNAVEDQDVWYDAKEPYESDIECE